MQQNDENGNVKESAFSFSNPRIVEILFETNENFDSKKYDGYGITIDSKISNKELASADVCLTISLGQNKETVPFTLKLSVMAKFLWPQEMDNEIVDSLLDKNAKILLLSYARPFIAHLTVDAGYNPFFLPFFDFTE